MYLQMFSFFYKTQILGAIFFSFFLLGEDFFGFMIKRQLKIIDKNIKVWNWSKIVDIILGFLIERIEANCSFRKRSPVSCGIYHFACNISHKKFRNLFFAKYQENIIYVFFIKKGDCRPTDCDILQAIFHEKGPK